VIYLLDVNALIGLSFRKHGFHRRVEKWVKTCSADSFATCPITELGFVRILAQHTDYDMTVETAREHLEIWKIALHDRLVFLADGLGARHLPVWVKHPRQTTDGHLVALAKAHSAVLATCDLGIPGALLIPE
jgi:predicted nucleic acid-binding protein